MKQIVKTRKYKAGYEVRTELWSLDNQEIPTEIKSAYTLNGDFIGSPKQARYLIISKGIKPEKAKPQDCICSIGFSEDEQLWYGWSHRAICGFGIGDEVKIGDCAFRPKNKEEFIANLKLWYNDELYDGVEITELEDCIIVKISYKTKNKNDISGITTEYKLSEIKFGKGEWIAKTLEDAKEMAIDFAERVS